MTSAALRRPATSVDIARSLGLSQATVSRALNGGAVSEATRRRVVAASESLGYRPNDVARGLVTQSTRTVGVVVSDVLNPFYPEFLEALTAALDRQGRRMLLQDAALGEDAALEALLRHRVDGIIMTAATGRSSVVRDLVASGFPLVLAHRSLEVDADIVESDNRRGAGRVAELLHRLGHRRIGVLEGDGSASTTRQRAAGFRERAGELGLDVETAVAGFDPDGAAAAARRLLDRPDRPTAVFGHNDTIAIAALNAAAELGLRVPDDLAVVGFDDIRAAGWPIVGLTTVRQPIALMARHAVELLDARIAGPAAPRRHVVLDTQLVERASTGVAR
jgi:LacI family transcriptional regulator